MVYGFNTRSFLRSTEHRQMKRMRREYTAWYLRQVHVPVEILPACNCPWKPYPHLGHQGINRQTDWRPSAE